MKADDLAAAARSRASQQAALDKRARRKEKKRAAALAQQAKQRAKTEIDRHGYIPRTKRRLPEYQAGPVTVTKPGAATVTQANPVSSEFLQTYEWRRVRMEALKKYGARCQCCGASPATGAVINVDHIKPRRLFPELALSLSNLQVLCADCNHGKGNWDMTDWRNRKEHAE